MNPEDYINANYDRQLYRLTIPPPLPADDPSLQLSDLSLPSTDAPSADPASISNGSMSGIFQIVSGALQSANFQTGSAGWRITSDGNLEANSGTFRGALIANSIDIPDTVTANSFHVNSSGDTWWGATSLGSALASVTKAGVATFKSVSVGGTTTQYTVNNSGIFSFGDGADGAAVFNGTDAVTGASLVGSTYTLTRDVYYTNTTISTAVIVNTVNYRMFGTGTLTLNGTAKIHNNGNAGGDVASGDSTAGTAGAAIPAGYFTATVAGGAGATGTNGVGSAGTNGNPVSNSLGVNGSGGGTGGHSSTATGNIAGGGASSGGTKTTALTRLVANWQLQPMLDIASSGSTVKFTSSGSSGGGAAGGGGGGGSVASGGGGGGSSGGVLAIYFRVIVDNASSIISANGGKGGDAGTVGDSAVGGSGGGGGGAGGVVVLVYNTYTALGTLTANGGAKGVGKAGGGAAGTSSGADGTVGSAGSIYQFSLSL